MDHLKLTVDKLSVDAVSELVVDDRCGAVSMFVGTTRDNFEGKKVVRLEYEAYEPMALKTMKAICDEVRSRYSAVHGIAIYHRVNVPVDAAKAESRQQYYQNKENTVPLLGNVPCREASVIIAVSSPHRRDSLDAVSLCIDLLKAKVPVWKREVYEDAAPAWKENAECAPTPPCDTIDPSLVQINVSTEELQQRINNFIARKREQANVTNIHDFIPDADETEDSCARVRTQFVRRSDSKGHLKIHRVHNEWGPQTATFRTAPATSPATPATAPAAVAPDTAPLPDGIAERVRDIETFLNIGPVPRDIYRRLKLMEDRIAALQAVSPEYAEFWKTQKDERETEQKPTVDFIYSADDIARKIEQLERMEDV